MGFVNTYHKHDACLAAAAVTKPGVSLTHDVMMLYSDLQPAGITVGIGAWVVLVPVVPQ